MHPGNAAFLPAMKRLILSLIPLLIIASAGVWGYNVWKARSTPHIAVTGGRSISLRLPRAGPHFMQNDPRWATDKIGGSGETIRGVGCAMCSVASAALHLGEKTDPGTFNQSLISTGGYTTQGWLVWSAVTEVFEQRIEVSVLSHPSHAAMDRALERGEYPVVKFILPAGIPHWVVVVGKEGQEYLVQDPLVASAEPVPLSSRASGIYSVRVVRKNA